MILRPRFRLPIWAALAIAGVAYGYRSVVLRNGDFSLNATDVIVAAVFLVALSLAWVARRAAAQGEREHPDAERENESRGGGDDR